MKNTPQTFEMLDKWWNAAEPGQECAMYMNRHPREQLTFWHCVMPAYPPPQINKIDYKHIHGVDGEFVRHLLGAGYSHERKIEMMRKVYFERGLNRTCTTYQYPC